MLPRLPCASRRTGTKWSQLDMGEGRVEISENLFIEPANSTTLTQTYGRCIMASNSFTLVCTALIMSTASSFVSQQIKSVYIQTNEPIYEVDDRLLSIALDTNLVRNRWHGFQLSERIITLCRGLQPAYLRIGGTAADFLIFDENALKQTTRADQDGLLYGKPIQNFTITTSDLDLIHEIASKAGWDVVFDLNVLLRTVDGSWNSSNPLKIMHYASDKGYNFSWQLGNGNK